MIRFSCPECDMALKVADEKAGGKINCPRCKTGVKVRGGAPAKPAEEAPLVVGGDGEKVYQRLLKSAAFIEGLKPDGSGWQGSGALIDKENKLVLTNYHVSGDGDATLRVCFPQYKNGQLIAPK